MKNVLITNKTVCELRLEHTSDICIHLWSKDESKIQAADKTTSGGLP